MINISIIRANHKKSIIIKYFCLRCYVKLTEYSRNEPTLSPLAFI